MALCVSQFLFGCALLPDSEQSTTTQKSRPKQTLADLNLMPARESSASVEDDSLNNKAILELSLQQKIDEYTELLALIDDPIKKQQILFRLSDLKMLAAEQALQQASGDRSDKLQLAIEQYIFVLQQNSILDISQNKVVKLDWTNSLTELNRASIMDTLYQLSRAFDLLGEKHKSVQVAEYFLEVFDQDNYSLTKMHYELWFRVGEYYFSTQQYRKAIVAYQHVVDKKAQHQVGNFYGISAYMLGWSHFKLDDYDKALAAFETMLQHSLTTFIDPNQARSLNALPLSKGELRLVNDAIRVMALTFSYQGDHQAILKFYQQYPKANHQYLIYEELAQQHLDNDRFQDSANALLGFASTYPSHPRAIELMVKHIDAYILGAFTEQVLEGKRQFVEQYSLMNNSNDWYGPNMVEQAKPYLYQYLMQLAQSEHSIAQELDAVIASRDKISSIKNRTLAFNSQSSKKLTNKQRLAWQTYSSDELYKLKQQSYSLAIAYYKDFIFSFQNDIEHTEKVKNHQFYLAEALYASGQFELAIEAFEQYARQYKDDELAVEAAYSVILAYNELLAQAPALAQTNQQNLALSQQYFLQTFGSDTRAPNISVALVQALFKDKAYEQALAWSNWILSRQSLHTNLLGVEASLTIQKTKHLDFDSQQIESALLVKAHSHYALQQYPQSEKSYLYILNNTNLEVKTKSELRESLAASIVNQSRQELDASGLTQVYISQLDLKSNALNQTQTLALNNAIGHLQRLFIYAPESSISVNALYDSAVYYGLLGKWSKAAQIWTDFAQKYPTHELAKDIDNTLLFAYEASNNWLQAANLLSQQYSKYGNSKKGQESLYLAAEYYLKAGNREKSLSAYRQYAHRFPEPLALANEARYKMSEFYVESNEQSKRRFWLKKMIDAQRSLGNQPSSDGTARSRYLAAMSAMVFAQDADYLFKNQKLVAPLDKNLKKKQQYLQRAIEGYDQVMSFAVAEFTSQANFKLGMLYSTLADDLMDSERPRNLSPLEAEQYEILLEEQAYPFEENAIDIHENNIQRLSSGIYDEFVKRSFESLSKLMPARYNKPEVIEEVDIDEL